MYIQVFVATFFVTGQPWYLGGGVHSSCVVGLACVRDVRSRHICDDGDRQSLRPIGVVPTMAVRNESQNEGCQHHRQQIPLRSPRVHNAESISSRLFRIFFLSARPIRIRIFPRVWGAVHQPAHRGSRKYETEAGVVAIIVIPCPASVSAAAAVIWNLYRAPPPPGRRLVVFDGLVEGLSLFRTKPRGLVVVGRNCS
ncbi:unnamed protein product, partial [Ectocarpus sp. 12 AP-2014]